MEGTEFHGGPVHRGRPGDPAPPPTGALSGTAREIVRLLEGTDGQASMGELAASFPTVSRAHLEAAVRQLTAAGVVTSHPATQGPTPGDPSGDATVRLRPPFREAIEAIPKKD